MNAGNLLDASTAHMLDFEWLVRAVAPVSAYGDRDFQNVRPFRAGEETQARARAASIAAFAATLNMERIEAIRALLAHLPDAAGTIARASMGDLLDDPQFLELSRFCVAVTRVDELLASVPHEALATAGIRAVGNALGIGSRDDLGFYLADAYDDELKRARERLARDQAELDAVRGREKLRIARALGRGEIAGDEFIVMRAEMPSPVPAGIRVVRESPTYWLCAVDYGDAALAALERRDSTAVAVADSEERVRTALSATVREHAAALDAAARALGRLDVTIAAAYFTQRHRCVAAEIIDEPAIAFEQARYLPLEAELEAAGRQFVPLDLDLHDVAVLTGPNMGGKSVSLRTCGFVALVAALGFPVPARRARTPLFDEIAWLGMGREEEVGGLLSSFAREVLDLKAILSRKAPRLLILVDEFGRTTTPHEGIALTVALLERLRDRGACGLLSTHLAAIAQRAGVRHFAVRGLRGIPRRPPTGDAAEALAALAEAMDYRIAEVPRDELPRGDAIALTALLGLDGNFVDAAYQALVQ
jgi:DNA mismatch repair protein MutS2